MVKIKKSCVIIAIVAMFFVMFSNIYAKDLNIYEDGDIDSNFSGDSNIKVSFKIKVKQFDRAPNTDGYVQISHILQLLRVMKRMALYFLNLLQLSMKK